MRVSLSFCLNVSEGTDLVPTPIDRRKQRKFSGEFLFQSEEQVRQQIASQNLDDSSSPSVK